jgi:hypothetical protein
VLVRKNDAALAGSRKTGLLFSGPVDWVERKRLLWAVLELDVTRLKGFMTGAAVVRGRVMDWRRNGRMWRRFILVWCYGLKRLEAKIMESKYELGSIRDMYKVKE